MKVKELIERLQNVNPEVEVLTYACGQWDEVDSNAALIIGDGKQIDDSLEFACWITPGKVFENNGKTYCLIRGIN